MSKRKRQKTETARHILPAGRTDGLATPQAAPASPENYLDGLREDSLLDGLIGCAGTQGATGGGWQNPVTGLGTFGRDKVMQGSYQEPFRISDPQISALFNGNDLAQRIIVTKPREMFRRGWTLTVPENKGGDGAPSSPQDGAEREEDTRGQGANEQPVGGESGPAAPGAPDNTTAKPTTAPPAPGSKTTGVDDLRQDPAKMGAAPALGQGAAQPKSTKKPNKPPKDGSQNQGADLAKQIEEYATRLGLRARCLEAYLFGRAFGGGLLVVGADDGQDMATPLDEENIKSVRYLSWMDRRFIFAATWYTEIGPKYGEVETWEIINPFGGQSNTRVHETRVIRFDGAPVDFLMRRRLMGWTLSVLQAPYDTMRQFDMSFQSVSNLMADISQAVMKINGLAQLISNDQKTLQTRMQMVDISRSSARMLYIDAENEAFERTPTPMTGVADVLEMLMLRTAAAAEMPVAILFGREPSGLNATGDADFRRFYDTIAGEQKTDAEPKLRRLYTLICAAKDSPTHGKVPDQGIEFVWHKLYEPSEKEQAEIRWLMAQADDKYIANGTLLPEEVALSRFRSGDLHLDTEIEKGMRDESLENAELAPSGAEKAKQEHDQQLAQIAAKQVPGPGGDKAAGKTEPGAVKPPSSK